MYKCRCKYGSKIQREDVMNYRCEFRKVQYKTKVSSPQRCMRCNMPVHKLQIGLCALHYRRLSKPNASFITPTLCLIKLHPKSSPKLKTPMFYYHFNFFGDSQNINVINQIKAVAAVPMSSLSIFELLNVPLGIGVCFLMKRPWRLETSYSVIYLTSQSRTLG